MDLRAYYESAFGETKGEIYGSAEDWTVIQRSGHFRRMQLLDSLSIPTLDSAVAVDFGMGSWGFASVFPKLRSAKECIGIDISEVALDLSARADAQIREKTRYLRSELSEIPLADGSVDVFWGGEVLEHVAEPRQFLQEISRVCRAGAHVILSTPNRDAVLYLADGQEYAIGPEHIALLNAEELRSLAEIFFDTQSMLGYETSLSPECDKTLSDPRVADLLQERTVGYPSLASGLLYHGLVNKAKEGARARKWSRTDVEWSDDRLRFTRPPDAMKLSGPLTGAGLAPGSEIQINLSGQKYVFFFWSHDWSGIAAVTVGDTTREIDLFSKQSGFRRLEVEFDDTETRQIRIVRSNLKSERSIDSQVIFHSIVAFDFN